MTLSSTRLIIEPTNSQRSLTMLKDFQRSRYHILKTAQTADTTPQIDSECGLRQNPPHKIPKKLSKSPKDFREFFYLYPYHFATTWRKSTHP